MTRKGVMKNIGLFGIKEPNSTVYYNPVFFEENKGKIVEQRDQCQTEEIDGNCYEFISGGIHIWYGNVNTQKKIKTRFENAMPYVHMVFSLRSASSYSFESEHTPTFKFSNQEHNILLIPDDYVYVELKPGTQIESLSINLSPELFFSYFPNTTSLFSSFRNSIDKKLPSRLSKQNLPITPKINSLLFDLLHCTLSGYSKRLYIEAKIIELLAVQIDQYEQFRIEPAHPKLKSDEVEKMYQIQQIICGNLDKTFSLRELSKQVGTNEYNLKKHFKQIFGSTVFGYIQDFRMQKAKEMLAEGDRKVADVGRQLGYKHATHFTTAFKKHFGFLPNKIKAILFANLFDFDLALFAEFL